MSNLQKAEIKARLKLPPPKLITDTRYGLKSTNIPLLLFCPYDNHFYLERVTSDNRFMIDEYDFKGKKIGVWLDLDFTDLAVDYLIEYFWDYTDDVLMYEDLPKEHAYNSVLFNGGAFVNTSVTRILCSPKYINKINSNFKSNAFIKNFDGTHLLNRNNIKISDNYELLSQHNYYF